MNKLDEYKEKLNYDVWVDVTNLPRKIFQESIKEYHASTTKRRKKSGEGVDE